MATLTSPPFSLRRSVSVAEHTWSAKLNIPDVQSHYDADQHDHHHNHDDGHHKHHLCLLVVLVHHFHLLFPDFPPMILLIQGGKVLTVSKDNDIQ